ncbi:hypothetical protein MRX96_057623 [Rhipicephalus microplus]
MAYSGENCSSQSGFVPMSPFTKSQRLAPPSPRRVGGSLVPQRRDISTTRRKVARLRKDQSSDAEQQAGVIFFLLKEGRFLREVLMKLAAAVQVQTAVALPASEDGDRSAISKPPRYCG